MNTLAETRVGRIVADNFKTAQIFTKYGIDFCCKGAIPLKEACEKNEVSLENISLELQDIMKEVEASPYQALNLSQLIDHIIETHHQYVSNSIPPLKAYLSKLSVVHGEKHPELNAIKDNFFAAADGLIDHMKKEELILFPYIKAMEEAFNQHFPLSPPHFGHIRNPIHMMEIDHDTEGERFRIISKLSNGYSTPSDGCQTYRVAYAMLKEFEEDLHTHIHLENNILFPKAIKLYEQLNS